VTSRGEVDFLFGVLRESAEGVRGLLQAVGLAGEEEDVGSAADEVGGDGRADPLEPPLISARRP